MAKLEATDLIFSLIGLTFEMQQYVHYGLWRVENIAETEAALTWGSLKALEACMYAHKVKVNAKITTN